MGEVYKMKTKIVIIGVLCALLLTCGCTIEPETTHQQTTTQKAIYPNGVTNYEVYGVSLLGVGYEYAPISVIPMCEDGVVLYIDARYRAGGIWGTRDVDLVEKYCGCEK